MFDGNKKQKSKPKTVNILLEITSNGMSTSNSISCIGFILDGNRRWARERDLPTLEGHRKGYEKLKDVVKWVKEANIPHVVAYGFSTENWNRSEEEVSYLMNFIRKILKEDLEAFRKEGGAVHIVGEKSLFPEDIQKSIDEVHASNPPHASEHLWLALSYGGRPEILAGVNTLLSEGKENVTEEAFVRALWTADMPDPDIIVRTGGERRLSGFLTWSSVYAELFFVDTYWPAFSKDDFDSILAEYHERERRHGK